MVVGWLLDPNRYGDASRRPLSTTDPRLNRPACLPVLPNGWHTTRQGRHVTPHYPREPNQRDKCQIVLAALDPADIAAVHPGRVRQSFLRHAKLAPKGADALAEDVEIRIAHIRNQRDR